MHKYKLLSVIGEGAYGKVFKAKNTETDEYVAVKRHRSSLICHGLPPSSLREIALLLMLSQDSHIVKLRSVEKVRHWMGDPIPVEPESGDTSHGQRSSRNPRIREGPTTPRPPREPIPMLYLIFEHLDLDLKCLMDEYRKNKETFSPRVVKEFMFQMLTGVCFCHSHGVLHRDLKPQNILVDMENGFLKLADFGLGREYNIPAKKYTSPVVTLWYRSPELLLGCPNYSTPVDIWSLGCIFVELVRMCPLFPAVSEFEQILLIFRLLGTPSEDEWEGLTSLKGWHAEFPQWRKRHIRYVAPGLDDAGLDLLSKMLLYDPSKRITAKRALSHPYFSDLDSKFLSTHKLL